MNVVLHKVMFVTMVAISLMMTGCVAPTQQLSDADRGKLKAASINATVQKPAGMFLLAPGSSVGLMFGAIGGALSAGGIEDSRKAFTAFAEKNSISIEKIVREEVELALRESGKIVIANPGDAATPTINITVQQYGFGVTNLLGSKVVPVLTIKCDMVDNGGKVLWSSSDRMGPSIANPMESTTWESMRDNPKLIEEQWRKASRYLAKKIVSEL